MRRYAIAAFLAAAVMVAVAEKMVPAQFVNARYVKVMALEGDIMDPHLLPMDRDAIIRTEDFLRKWKRYAITSSVDSADLIIVVRPGRLGEAQVAVNIGTGRDQKRPRIAPEIAGKLSTTDDYLAVHDGHLAFGTAPVWFSTAKDGLAKDNPVLLEEFKKLVEEAAARQQEKKDKKKH